jgi:2-phospho-L-lactate/phosphoenolpyruvate guanylyltransferase
VDAGLLPVKALAAAKQRLSPEFNPEERRDIARALLEDALQLCVDSSFMQWWIVTSDTVALSAARRRGLRIARDAGAGLNHALRGAVEAAARAGATSVTVIPADLPLATPGDLVDLLDTGATSDLVIVPAQRDGGTNALHVSRPGSVDPRFGAGSLQSYVELADRMRLRCSILPLERLALDIDTVEDVGQLLQSGAAGHTAALLGQLRPITR